MESLPSHTNHFPLVIDTPGPAKKKRKVEKAKKSKGEKAMENAITAFMKYQSEADERFQKLEEERWKKETEMEEKRRKDERDHELRLFQMLGQMVSSRERAQDHYSVFPTQPFNYDHDAY